MKFFTKLSARTLMVCLLITASFAAFAQPANDLCANAVTITCGAGPYSGTNIAATGTGEPTTSCTTTPGSFGVWYRYVGTGDIVTLTTCAAATPTMDTKLNVYTGTCGTFTCVIGNDDNSGCTANGASSQVSFVSTLGTEYFVLVTGFGTETGNFTLGISCAPLPANDLCANATVVSCGSTVSGSNVGATGTGEPTTSCTTTPGSLGVWYSYVGTGDIVTVSTCSANALDTKLNIYTGSCGTFTCVIGNDDNSGCAANTATSQATFNSVLGTTYYILVTGFGSATGNFSLAVTCVTPLANDDCANAIAISCTSGTVYGTNNGATNTGNPATCITAPGTASVWYTFAGTGQFVTLSTCDSSNFDTKLNVYRGVCGSFTCITGNDNNTACTGATGSSEVKFQTVLDTTYYIVVSGLGTATGNFGLNISCAAGQAANDSCIRALAITCATGTVSGSNVVATGNGDPTTACGSVTPGAYGVWYSFVGTGDGISLSTCAAGTNFDTKLNVYSGTCASPVCVTGNDNNATCSANSSSSALSFNSVLGTQYYVLVSGNSGANGNFDLSIVCTPPPANDLCANATPITCGATVTGSTTGATGTGEPTTSCTTTPGSFGVWYSYVGTGQFVVLSTCNAANFDTKLNVYTGSCGTFTCVTGNDNYATGCSNNSSRLGFQSILGTTYYVLVTGLSTAVGNFSLTTTCYGPNTAAIDSCSGTYTSIANDTINSALAITRDTLNITSNPLDTITDLNVIVNLRHTYVGDIFVILTHLSTGTVDTIVSRPTSVSAACSQNNINAKFDDSALNPIICGPVTGTDSSALARGPYLPFRPLSVFNGKAIGGLWEMKIVDASNGDNGRLLTWCLEPTLRPYACTAPVATFRDSCNPANSAFFVIATVTNFGNAPSLNITNSANATVVTANTTGDYVLGPFTPGTLVDITLTNSASGACFLTETGRTTSCIIQNPCVNPAATINAYCNGTDGTSFYIDVVVTDIGSGPSLNISNSLNATTLPVTAAGTYTAGPFANNAVVDVVLANDTAAGCNVTALGLSTDCTPVCTTGVFAGNDTTICAGQAVRLGDPGASLTGTVQFENFNACALPSGWTLSRSQGTADWRIGNPPSGNGPTFTGINGTCLAFFDDDNVGNNNYNIVELRSPAIDASNFISAELNLDVFFDAFEFSNVYSSDFSIAVWDGTAYQVLQSGNSDIGGATWDLADNRTYNLTPYLNSALHIRFVYDDGDGWNNWVGFDNFAINAVLPSSGTYAWTPAVGLNDATSPVPVATPTNTTTYVVSYVDGLCSYADTVTITVNPLPLVAIAGAGATYCVTESTPVQLFGLPAGGTFSGSGIVGSTFVPSNGGAGTKVLTYSYTDANGCTNTDRDTVLVNPQPVVTLNTVRPLYCIYDLPDTLFGSPAGGTYAGNGVTGNIFSPSAAGAGSHTVTYIYQNPTTGCRDTASLTLGVVSVAVTFNSPGGPYCAEDTNRVALSVSPAGGTFVGPGVSNGQFQPSAAGAGIHTLTYLVDSFITYQLDTNCSFNPITPVSPTTITLGDDVLSSAINLPFTFKFYGQNRTGIKISSNGWITFDVATTGSALGNTLLPTAGVPNDVIAGMWDDLFSPSVDYFTVGTAPNRVFVVNFNTSYHFGSTASTVRFQILLNEGSNIVQILCLDCNADASFPTATQGIENANGTSGITVPGRGDNGWSAFSDCTAFIPTSCTYSETQDVTVNPTPNASAGNDTSICLGGTATLTATGGASYLWNNGQTTASITVSPGATTAYNVRVTSASGCVDRDTVLVTVLPTPVVALPDPTICQGSNTTLDAGNAGATFAWSTSATSQTINVNAAGDYIVTVTLASGCTDTDTATVGISTSLTVNPGNPGICPGDTATLNAGNPGASYVWSTGALSQTIQVSAPGTYTVVVTDASNCTGAGSSTVTVNVVPTVTLPDPTICVGSTTTLSAGNTGATFAWSTGDNTQSVTVNNGGNYIVTVTNNFGCEDVDTATVTVGTGLVVTVANLSVCPGDTATLDAGYPGSSYLWNTGDTTQTITATSNGGFVVTVTDNSGCSGVGGGSVSLRVPEAVNAGVDAGVCPGGSVVLTASGNVNSFQWTGGPATATYTVSPTTNTTYTVTGIDANGCASTDEVEVEAYTAPNASAGNDAVSCAGATVTLTATGGVAYQWSNGDNTAEATVTPSGATTYTVTVTDANGCTATDEVEVTVASLPNVTLTGLDSLYCVSDPAVTLVGTPAGGTFAGVGVVGSTFNPGNGQYGLNNVTYTYTDASGCANTANVQFNVTYCTGIDEPIFSESVTVYPNPFSNEVFVRFEAAYDYTITLSMRDMLGKTISQQEVQIVAGANEIRLDANENLAGGIYFVELQSLKESRSFKLVKLR